MIYYLENLIQTEHQIDRQWNLIFEDMPDVISRSRSTNTKDGTRSWGESHHLVKTMMEMHFLSYRQEKMQCFESLEKKELIF